MTATRSGLRAQPANKSTIINGLPSEYNGQLKFHTVPGEPQEPHIEVGPGKKGKVAGGALVDHPDQITKSDDNAIQFDQMPVSVGRSQPPLASNYPAGGAAGVPRS